MIDVETQAAAWSDIWTRFRSNGPGSSVAVTAPARAWLEHVITTYNITSMLDAPCGTGEWMSLVDLGGVKYHGWDVQPDVLATAQANMPSGVFRETNILTARRLPKVDLIWSRDFLIHLPLEAAVRVVNKFRGAAKYLAVTNHPQANNHVELPEYQDDRPGYWCRGLCLEAEPFNLTRIDSVVEASDGTALKNTVQELILVEL